MTTSVYIHLSTIARVGRVRKLSDHQST